MMRRERGSKGDNAEKFRELFKEMDTTWRSENKKYYRICHFKTVFVGCFHWAYYSILFLFGAGKDFKTHPTILYWNGTIDSEKEYTPLFTKSEERHKAHYIIEGLFCLFALLYLAAAIIALVRSIKDGYIFNDIMSFDYILQFIYPRLYSFMLKLDFGMGLLTFISLFLSKSFFAHLINLIIVKNISHDILPFIVHHRFLGMALFIIVGIATAILWFKDIRCTCGFYCAVGPQVSKNSNTSTTNTSSPSPSSYSKPAHSSAPSPSVSSQSRREEEERYQQQREEDAKQREIYRLEDKKRSLERDLRKLKDNLAIQTNKRDDCDKGYERYLKKEIGNFVDPKVNRREHADAVREIDRLNEKIRTAEAEIRAVDDEMRKLR